MVWKKEGKVEKGGKKRKKESTVIINNAPLELLLLQSLVFFKMTSSQIAENLSVQ